MTVHSLPWYYAPDLADTGGTYSLSGDEWHHAHHVLRMEVGESLILFDGRGRAMEGCIRHAGKQSGSIDIVADRSEELSLRRPYSLTVAFAPTKNIDRTEFAIEKLVELGVDEIILLDCEHAERSYIRLDRLEKIIISAAKQSRKARLSVLHDFVPPTSCVTQFRKEQPDAQVFCCHLTADATPLTENYVAGKNVLLLIGPEGGFTAEEIEQMTMRGAVMVILGPSRLRVETAALAACHTVHVINILNLRTL